MAASHKCESKPDVEQNVLLKSGEGCSALRAVVVGLLKKTTGLLGLAVCNTNEKLGMAKAEPDAKKLEDQIQGGQIEEVILQAGSELSLAGNMIQWKPWEWGAEEPPAGRWKWLI
ncbi:NADH dehydrogenase [ubiquinone] 1 alpha subcomplex subunit 5-like [Phyllostomus hastatus]|uniref:NADH dehydrogenase [ubiquinone] 1 alpha subcomplex subunit 5-like n=1 Tax=Phyllostomus hastatus TaxID=9423 RepID=UPI001E67E5A9|nr:NADH dehydrogenase [ubiquinone] 1 alpha subcomplex subunit 5-like [Phyllostomus hastatus]